jgi:bifunctional DNA-binding transcriptional regulator/antitoxin component of YhaV-PrlF toxin-antitoxin module
MSKLIAISPIGKNGQTVVPAPIRKMFKVSQGHNLVGFYVEGTHVEIAPVAVSKEEVDYTSSELDKLEHLSKQKGGKKFKTAIEAKKYLESL